MVAFPRLRRILGMEGRKKMKEWVLVTGGSSFLGINRIRHLMAFLYPRFGRPPHYGLHACPYDAAQKLPAAIPSLRETPRLPRPRLRPRPLPPRLPHLNRSPHLRPLTPHRTPTPLPESMP